MTKTIYKQLCETYLAKIFQKARSNVREESYYPILEDLLRQLAEAKNKKIQVDSFPKKTEGGNPDIRVLTKNSKLIGYIEAKPPEIGNLETLEDSRQIKRYKDTFPNFIFTNLLEFRLYREGQPVGKPVKISDLRTFLPPTFKEIPVQNSESLIELLEQFLSFSTPRVYTAKALATELAKKTRFLRDEIITQELEKEEIIKSGSLFGFYQAFRKYLIASLDLRDFADLYAQTITYGLFIARHRYEMHPTLFNNNEQKRPDSPFNRELAYQYIQPSLGILREVFKFVSFAETAKQLIITVDDIADLLAAADLEKVVKSFYRGSKGKDPIVHFYETFLAEYDPEEREKRGVYYTPEPVVSYITRSIHHLLKQKFYKEDGFASANVTVLDPAAGTLTFPALAIELAVDEFKRKYGSGGIKKLIKDHILKNFYAFELMMAPYAVGHLKIDFILEKLGYKFDKGDRFKLYLTNTLEMKELEQSQLPGMVSLSEESKKAGKVKRKTPILVILGNPPYSGISENKGEWILEKIEDYKQIDGKSLKERKYWLQDDYVKFFRFAQWKIEQAGVGILGFITNHAWLDNPTFRGMRYSLMKTFDEIYILNLHGSTLKKEKTPEGGKDENVFDIRPGVAISIFVKHNKSKRKEVFYSDQWGLRKNKYNWLETHDIKNTKWQKLSAPEPYYFFVPKEKKGWGLYRKFWPVTDIFPINSVGIVTARDNFVIDFNRQSLESKIRVFRDKKFDDQYVKQYLQGVLKRKSIEDVENYAWRVKEAREQLQGESDWEDYFVKILYRPFDERWIYYHPSVVWRTRDNIMKHMLQPNLALVTCRQVASEGFKHALVAEKITESCYISNKTREIGYTFPLYLYNNNEGTENGGRNNPGPTAMMMFDKPKYGYQVKKPNLAPKLLTILNNIFGKEPTPEEIFYYIYAVLHSNIYRQKYQGFLKIDFPRIPFTKNYKIFQKIAALGKQLVDLHLLKSDLISKPVAKFYGKNSYLVEKREYQKREKQVYINDLQYFGGISPEVWNYQIGGYQVLDKWLKDRKGRILSAEDIKHHCKVVTALSATIKIQKQIDKLYPKIEEIIKKGETK